MSNGIWRIPTTEGFQLAKNTHGNWHIVKWKNLAPDRQGGQWIQTSLCQNKRIRHGIYPDGSVPAEAYREEVDLSIPTCVRCRQRYDNILVRELREELKEL